VRNRSFPYIVNLRLRTFAGKFKKTFNENNFIIIKIKIIKQKLLKH
jgi:hypothetical protein